MKLIEYNLLGWKENKITRQKKFGNKKILLLSLDRTIGPPEEGRKNLLAIDEENNIVWIADLPTEVYDSYYEMKFDDGIIYGRSSNSFISEINPETGEILKKYMVKQIIPDLEAITQKATSKIVAFCAIKIAL